jgi:hypothetical protein
MKKACSSRLRTKYPIMVQEGLVRQLMGGQRLVYQVALRGQEPGVNAKFTSQLGRAYHEKCLILVASHTIIHEAHDPLGTVIIRSPESLE